MLRHLLEPAKARSGGVSRDENQYLRLAECLVREGELQEGRNGRVRAGIGAAMHFDLRGGKLPLLTTKRVAWKTCLRELLWFLRGSTDERVLAKEGVKIWEGNATREFLDERGLTENRVGDLGPVYGHQWRHAGAPYEGADADYSGKGVDQIAHIVETLRDPSRRTCRRMILCAWNPSQLHQMALPPCHAFAQFNVTHGKYLSCSLYQRSADVALGVPFNIASYAFLTHILAHHCGLEALELIHHLGHCHVYEGHGEGLLLQCGREPRECPTVRISPAEERHDPAEYAEEDFTVVGYNPHPRIQFAFSA